MKSIRFLLPAELEMFSSSKYYDCQAKGLGNKFLDKIEFALQDITSHPNRFPIIKYNIRRRLIHRFPYAILYRIDKEEIVILAVMHLRRQPNYWLNRTNLL